VTDITNLAAAEPGGAPSDKLLAHQRDCSTTNSQLFVAISSSSAPEPPGDFGQPTRQRIAVTGAMPTR